MRTRPSIPENMSQRNPIGDLVVFEHSALPAVEREAEDYLEEKDVGTRTPSFKDDGLIHGSTFVNGEWKEVSWTIGEQHRVVRKADFFLLPIFAVSRADEAKVKGVPDT